MYIQENRGDRTMKKVCWCKKCKRSVCFYKYSIEYDVYLGNVPQNQNIPIITCPGCQKIKIKEESISLSNFVISIHLN